jgi:predicted enzyme related to lactoylglutathione lyase
MTSEPLATEPHLFRILLPVSNIEKAAEFYGRLLGISGERVAPNRHYFHCGGTILACLDPQLGGRAVLPNPEPISFAVPDIEASYERAKQAGCQTLDTTIQVQHWGERAFFATDPFGNPLCFVDEATVFTGRSRP